MLVWRKEEGKYEILIELSVCYSIVNHYNIVHSGTSSSSGQLSGLGFDLAIFSSLSSECLCVFGLCDAVYI